MNKTVLITGATGRLGRIFSRHLASLGWNLILTSRDVVRCTPIADELKTSGVTIHTTVLDLLCTDSVESLGQRIADMGATVTHVVSNARSLESLAVCEDSTTQRQPFMDELAIDVVGPYRILTSLARDPRHDLRAVVTIGSQYGQVVPNPALYDEGLRRSPVQYGVAKAALHHMTRELAIRFAPRVRVNCVAYGGFAWRSDTAFQDRYARMVPLGRMLTEEDASGPVAFLLDDRASSAVTGHVLIADGGWSIW